LEQGLIQLTPKIKSFILIDKSQQCQLEKS